MVSILPQKISPFQLIGQAMSQLGQNTPELLEIQPTGPNVPNALVGVANGTDDA